MDEEELDQAEVDFEALPPTTVSVNTTFKN
jgi:hypothetical protein